MTSPAERFKANLKAKEDASKKNLDEIKDKMSKQRDIERARMAHYSDSLRELMPDLKKWAESGGLKARKIGCSYHDYKYLVADEALLVSDGHKEIRFVPNGVERAGAWLGTVHIELPKSTGFHQIYLALEFDQNEQKRSWFYVDYDSQVRRIVTKRAVDEAFFFELMEKVFLTN